MQTVKSPNPNLTSQNGVGYVNYVSLPPLDKPAGQPCGVLLDRQIWSEYGLSYTDAHWSFTRQPSKSSSGGKDRGLCFIHPDFLSERERIRTCVHFLFFFRQKKDGRVTFWNFRDFQSEATEHMHKKSWSALNKDVRCDVFSLGWPHAAGSALSLQRTIGKKKTMAVWTLRYGWALCFTSRLTTMDIGYLAVNNVGSCIQWSMKRQDLFWLFQRYLQH